MALHSVVAPTVVMSTTCCVTLSKLIVNYKFCSQSPEVIYYHASKQIRGYDSSV